MRKGGHLELVPVPPGLLTCRLPPALLANGQKPHSSGLGHHRECWQSRTKLVPGGSHFSGPQKSWLVLLPQPVSLRPVGRNTLMTIPPQVPS